MCFLQLLLTEFFEIVCLTECKTQQVSYTSWQIRFRDLSPSTLAKLGLKRCVTMLSFSHMCWEFEL